MKIQLPDGRKTELDEHISLDEKKQVVEQLTEEWMPIIKRNWTSKSVMFFLDNLANYLVWHKEPEEKGKEDKTVLSVKKIEEMTGKRKGKSKPFSSLNNDDKELLGLERESK